MKRILVIATLVAAVFAGSANAGKTPNPTVVCSNGGCDSGGGWTYCNNSSIGQYDQWGRQCRWSSAAGGYVWTY